MPPHVSTAKMFFDDLKVHRDPFAYLAAIPDREEPFFEAEWLDFKGQPRDDPDAKKIWSKALSGYANLTDGLIISGIDARPMPPRNIDAACGLKLIQDPPTFESKMFIPEIVRMRDTPFHSTKRTLRSSTNAQRKPNA